MPPPTTITAHAPAKLNLALSVGPPEVSGLHPICSWMITVDLMDELVVTRLDEDRLSRYAILWHEDAKRRSEIEWSITSDLAVRAHVALEQHVGRRLPVQLRLDKRIPVGGGLGGGSSDGATMLRIVNELFELGLDTMTLTGLAAGLGSDVPFLLAGGSAVVGGTGEQIIPVPEPETVHAVVAFPDVACPTGAVYAAFDEHEEALLRADAIAALTAGGVPAPETLFNDLTTPAIRVAPQLEPLLRALADLAERPAHVSGSGSSLFVVCADDMHAEALAAAVEERLDLPAVAVKSHEVMHADSF